MIRLQLSQIGSAQKFFTVAFRVDFPLFLITLLLCILGLTVQFSAAGENIDQLMRQVIRVGVAIVVMLALATVSAETVRRYAPQIYSFGVVLLILVLVIGIVGRGAQRWLDLGLFRFQPSELIKLALPMMVAWVLTHSYMGANRKSSFLVCGALVLVPGYLVYLQPDLGTALLIVAVGVYAIFLGGLSWRWVGLLGALGLALIPAAWPLLQDYQKDRIITLFNPWNDPLGHGYHSIQSMVAIGSGGFSGKGWLQGSQSQLDFLPERSTDFVFSVFAEEFGFLGSALLILLYSLLITRCLIIAYRCDHDFARIVAGSIAIMIFFQVFVNIGMVSGILPVVGLPLPIISYGGTSLVTVLAGIGLVMGAKHAKRSV